MKGKKLIDAYKSRIKRGFWGVISIARIERILLKSFFQDTKTERGGEKKQTESNQAAK